MADVEFAVDPREVTGKKVKALRRDGIIPAHLYGRGLESLSLQASRSSFLNLMRTASRNAIIDLRVNGEQEAHAVLLRSVQRDPVTGDLVHIDFFQISLTEKLKMDVPLVLEGTALGVTVQGGVLLQNVDRVAIEALPADIPARILVDVSGLEEIGNSVFLRDLPIPERVTVLADPGIVVARVVAPKQVVEVEEELEEGEEVEGEEGEGEGEGEGEAEGDGEGERKSNE